MTITCAKGHATTMTEEDLAWQASVRGVLVCRQCVIDSRRRRMDEARDSIDKVMP